MGCFSTTDGYGNNLNSRTCVTVSDDIILIFSEEDNIKRIEDLITGTGLQSTVMAVQKFHDACLRAGRKLYYDSDAIRSTLRSHNSQELKKLHDFLDREEKKHHIKKLLPWQLDFQKKDIKFLNKSINRLFGRVECLRI